MTVFLPVVDERRCCSTADCIAVCPTGCLELRRGEPTLARPHECISCELCQAVCPVEALHMEERWVG